MTIVVNTINNQSNAVSNSTNTSGTLANTQEVVLTRGLRGLGRGRGWGGGIVSGIVLWVATFLAIFICLRPTVLLRKHLCKLKKVRGTWSTLGLDFFEFLYTETTKPCAQPDLSTWVVHVFFINFLIIVSLFPKFYGNRMHDRCWHLSGFSHHYQRTDQHSAGRRLDVVRVGFCSVR